MKIYLHMGIHKTGTTSIQKACLISPMILASEGKKYFSGIFPNGNHQEVAYAVLRKELIWPGKARYTVSSEKAFEVIREKIKKELEVASELVISAEALSYIRQNDEVQRLKVLFPPEAEVIPIIYLREKKEWLESYRLQILKQGDALSEELNSTHNVSEESWVNKHEELVALLKFSFPKTQILTYDEKVVERFSRAIGLQQALPEVKLNLSINSTAKKKIFQIGFNKCGTTSMARFFRESGIKTLHYAGGRIAKLLYLNITSGKPVLNGMSEYTAFTDMEDPSGNIFGHRFYKEIYNEYPDAYFILNTRDKVEWLNSRVQHKNGELLSIMKKNFGLSPNQTIAYWSREWDVHHQMVMSFFKNKGNFMIFDLTKNSPNELTEFLKEDFQCDSRVWGHYNITKD